MSKLAIAVNTMATVMLAAAVERLNAGDFLYASVLGALGLAGYIIYEYLPIDK